MQRAMLKVGFVVFMFVLIGCAVGYNTANHTEYSIDGKTVTIGMTPQEVRDLFGTPTKIYVPESDPKAQMYQSMSPTDMSRILKRTSHIGSTGV